LFTVVEVREVVLLDVLLTRLLEVLELVEGFTADEEVEVREVVAEVREVVVDGRVVVVDGRAVDVD